MDETPDNHDKQLTKIPLTYLMYMQYLGISWVNCLIIIKPVFLAQVRAYVYS